MLPKRRRIARKEFPNILKFGKRYNSEHLLLTIIKTEQTSPSKFSFSVSKKVLKNAVDRNKYRRRGYSIIRQLLKGVHQSFLCFFSFKRGSGDVKFRTLEKEITKLLSLAFVIS